MNNLKNKWFYLILLSIIWGSSFILIKKSLIGLNPYQLGAIRTILTGIILLIFGFKKLRHVPIDKWKWIGLSALLGSFFPAFLFAFAETEIDSAIASILNSLVPLNTILIGLAIFKIGTNTQQVIGVIIGFVGTAILILKGADINPNQNYLFAGFVIIATLMYASNSNLIKYHLQNVKPLAIAAGSYAIIIIPAFVVLLFSDFFKSETYENPNLKEALVYVLVLSVFGTALAKVVFNRLVQISTPVFASSVAYLMPIVAVIWGLLDGEKFSIIQAFAAILILFGVYLANKGKKKK